jgi:diadenylate cyclase
MFHTLIPFIEIGIIAIMLNYLLSFFWNTRSMDLILGLLAFLLIYAASSLFNLPILHKLMLLFANVAMLGILIIFQPELRVALSKLSVKGKRIKEGTEFDKFLDQLATSIYRMADKRMGALIVLEHENGLDEYAGRGVLVDARFSSELIESIFSIGTPLHDGAVLIKDKTVSAAAVILPLAEESSQVTRGMGTRHRAGLGITQVTDAIAIVISEESGKVSIAREGIMTRGVKVDRFKGIIRSIFTPPQKEEAKLPFKLKQWIRE